MKINEQLNLVIPVGDRHAYHTPISQEVFEENYRIICATKAAVSDKGPFYQLDTGPLIAALALKDAAMEDAAEQGDFDTNGKGNPAKAIALLAEIQRLTSILCPTKNGWEALPVDTAIQQGHIDKSDWREAESAIVFFTCLLSPSKKAGKEEIAQATASLLKGSITSLTPSAYAISLQELMTEADSQTAGS